MPELPEMETYKQLLTLRVAGATIASAEVNRERTVNLPVEHFVNQVTGSRISNIERRAKHLLFRLNSGNVLLLHLMLGGWLFYGTEEQRPDGTAQVVLTFSGKRLFFFGLRLGYLHLLNSAEVSAKLADVGPEPLSAELSADTFAQRIASRRGMLKSTLVNQQFISGIGNRYADEICFHAAIHPLRKIQTLAQAETYMLYHSMRSVLTDATAKGGYMKFPFYEGDMLTGGMVEHLKVYDRAGEPCLRCGAPIQKQIVSSRKVFYCSACQR